MEKSFEIRSKKGTDDYSTILHPVTKLNNVIFKRDKENTIYAEEEIMTIYKILNQSRVTSTSVYICEEKNQSIIPINNPNYNYLDSEVEVYYNGLLLIHNTHYIIYNINNIMLLEFECSFNDEIIFKVLNPNKVKIDLDYENPNLESGKEIKEIIDSINSYINLINNGKKLIADEFQNANININWNDSFEEMAKELSKALGNKKYLPKDLGNLFSMPYFEINVSFIYGALFGVKIENNILPKNLGTLF